MKRIFAVLTLSVGLFAFGGCGQYDAYRVTQIERHKQNTHEGIQRALNGKLTRVEYESILQSFDTSAIDEQAKDPDGLEELKKKLDADTKAKVDELFPKKED